MGFWDMFPYLNLEELNVDWVMQVIHKSDELIKNINQRIETVVRPMIDAQNQFYQNLVNQALSDNRNQIAYMDSKLKDTERRINRLVYDSNAKTDRAVTDIKNALASQLALVQTEMSNSINQMTNTLSYYKAVFDSQSESNIRNVNQILKEHDLQFAVLVEGQKAELNQLKAYVDGNILMLDTRVANEVLKLNNAMDTLRADTVKLNADTLDRLNELGNELANILLTQNDALDKYYKYVSDIIDNMFVMLDHSISLKADKVYVDAQIARLESLIKRVNDDIMLINPADGKLAPLQQILTDIYAANNPLSITAGEYDSLLLSAHDYDSLGLTAYQYDFYAKWYLILYREIFDYIHSYVDGYVKDNITPQFETVRSNIRDLKITLSNLQYDFNKCCTQVNDNIRMYNPVTGEYELIKNILPILFNGIRLDALTALEYDDKQLTALDYDAKDITASQYDWHSKTILS